MWGEKKIKGEEVTKNMYIHLGAFYLPMLFFNLCIEQPVKKERNMGKE